MYGFPIHKDFRLEGKAFQSFVDLLNFVELNYPQHAGFLKNLFDEHNFISAQTSGSTGRPKKIYIKKKYLIKSAQKTINFFKLKPGSAALLNLSSQYIAGKLMWVRALAGGWLLDISDPGHQSIARKLTGNIYDFGAMVPLQVSQNLEKIHHIKTLIVGGGQVPGRLLNRIRNLPNRIFATYGMTETLTHVAVMPLNKVARQNFTGQNTPVGAYRTLEGVKIASDNRNCLIIEAPDIFEGRLVTNDVVELIDNKHFRWLGRYDNIINSGGIKLIPELIEDKLKQIIDFDFFIAGMPDDKLGEKVILVMETGTYPATLKEEIKKILSKYEMPKNIYTLTQFERTLTGKIQRQSTLKKIKVNLP